MAADSVDDFQDPLGVRDPWADLRPPTMLADQQKRPDEDLHKDMKERLNDDRISSDLESLRKLTITDTPGAAGSRGNVEPSEELDSEVS